MRIYTEIIGNRSDPEWLRRLHDAAIDTVALDQWTAQKHRFVASGESGHEYAVALPRHTQLLDGDILEYNEATNRAVVVRIRLNDVMVADLEGLLFEPSETILRVALELGHAVGNQHWPAVVKGTKVYIPLTVDKKLMNSVMHTHRIEHVRWSFQRGSEVIPYLAPHEVRRLFGSSEPHDHHHSHPHLHDH